MTPRKARLQSRVLWLRRLPLFSAMYRGYYTLAQKVFCAFVNITGKAEVKSVYLRRGGGRNELVPGASDLDFFLVLETLPAETEMEFLKKFWQGYHRLRFLFPFLGEVLMGDENELVNWLGTPSVRAYEAQFSWKLLSGKDVVGPAPAPDLRDLFSEALKHYADLLQALLKLRPEQFHAALQPHEPGAALLRHAAKAALDLFRLHESFRTLDENIWRASRAELSTSLSAEYGPALRLLPSLLRLEGNLFTDQSPFELFSSLAHTSLRCLDQMARALKERNETFFTGTYNVGYGRETSGPSDLYSLSVRELFAERTLLRHAGLVSRALLAEETAGIYFTLYTVPSLEDFRALLLDLRDVSFSFDRLSVAMPITDSAFAELERTSLLDTPFHSCAGYREIKLTENGELLTSPHRVPDVRIPESMLRKTFAELSFGLRLQPRELEHFLEKKVALVLSLRLAATHHEISTTFESAFAQYGKLYPLRQELLRAKLQPYLPINAAAEEKIWAGLYSRLAELGEEANTSGLRSQLENIRRENRRRPLSRTLPSDLWINLTPFLRMEMNAMKEQYFEQRPALKI